MAAVDYSEYQGIITLLETRGITATKKIKEGRMAKVQTVHLPAFSLLTSVEISCESMFLQNLHNYVHASPLLVTVSICLTLLCYY